MRNLSMDLTGYLKANEDQLKNSIIHSFLAIPGNMELLKQVIEDPTDHLIHQLDESFKEFYFRIWFTSYLSKTIHFHSINFDKRHRQNADRFRLILDKPLSSETETSLLDVLATTEFKDELSEIEMSFGIEDQLTNYWLYEGYRQLTENQRQIISLAYLHGLTDSEIAHKLNRSQQAVSKSHARALKKMRDFLETASKREEHR
ncbi:sigma-70 family RNA polymerase sigma factor [Cytobacillus dafuensis]|uniref:Sigma-70 family RNA polymerase sigma factor n=1 Tax=Cytobacillus dafuensis TaxID=1742359 RepID=A0A5B8ZEU8_CYTDA|nr:sigma-70 family RNA polymerase sigma factor [Cytobacillus dafuensis]QED50036.1 sigma-70 family RNA polymerase sigma factor [Cytobacillus dafuensis]